MRIVCLAVSYQEKSVWPKGKEEKRPNKCSFLRTLSQAIIHFPSSLLSNGQSYVFISLKIDHLFESKRQKMNENPRAQQSFLLVRPLLFFPFLGLTNKRKELWACKRIHFFFNLMLSFFILAGRFSVLLMAGLEDLDGHHKDRNHKARQIKEIESIRKKKSNFLYNLLITFFIFNNIYFRIIS